MNEAVHTILGYSFYATGLGLVVVFPFIVWFLFALMKYLSFFQHDKHNAKAKTIIIPIVFIMISFFAVFGDVIWLGIKATRICKKTEGYKINRVVKAEGFIGASDIKYYSKYGFKYVEDSIKRKKYRYEMIDSAVNKKKINQYSSIYEFKISRNYDSKYIRKIKYSIENIETSEVIGEYNTIAVKPGWFDNVLSGLWGNPGTPIICCDGKLQRTSSINKGFDLILKTIQPAGE